MEKNNGKNSKMKKNVVLYSSDGFDLDVLENQIQLYESLGCNVIWTNKLIPCDLLVVLRSENNEKWKKIDVHQSILFIDYSGQKVNLLFERVNVKNKACITSRKNFESFSKNIFFGHPYISLNKFSRGLKALKFENVHIGNFKMGRVISGIDISFLDFLNIKQAHVWGKNWESKNFSQAKFMGPLKPSLVSEVYCQSRIAFGIKHDFQIGVSISGRYWHSTINGCALLVEDDYLIDEIPGIYKYGENVKETREEIQHKAQEYWRNQNNLQIQISQNLLSKTKSRTSIKFKMKMIESILYKTYREITYGFKSKY